MQALINNLIKKIAFLLVNIAFYHMLSYVSVPKHLYLCTMFFFYRPTVYFIYNKTFFLCCVCIYYKISIELNAKVYFCCHIQECIVFIGLENTLK